VALSHSTLTSRATASARVPRPHGPRRTGWFYTCLSAFIFDYPNLFIDTVAEKQRVIPWLAFRYTITGLLYWETVYAYRHTGDPWSRPYLMVTNGEGNLLYPGTPGERT